MYMAQQYLREKPISKNLELCFIQTEQIPVCLFTKFYMFQEIFLVESSQICLVPRHPRENKTNND